VQVYIGKGKHMLNVGASVHVKFMSYDLSVLMGQTSDKVSNS